MQIIINNNKIFFLMMMNFKYLLFEELDKSSSLLLQMIL